MARDVWQKTITSSSGDVLDGAQITVRNQQTSALAAVFDAQSGGSQRPNPFLTGADGVARFFAEPGFYKVTAFKDGFGTAEFIWNNLGDNNLRQDVGTAAFANVTTSATDTTAGRLLKVGDGGLLRNNANQELPDGQTTDLDQHRINGLWRVSAVTPNNPLNSLGQMIHAGQAGDFAFQLFMGNFGSVSTPIKIMARTIHAGAPKASVSVYHTGNTTVDGNGFIKQASPIVNLYNDKAEPNDLAGDVELRKVGVGHYELSGVEPLASEGWYIETPKDRNGNIYFTLDYEQKDGKLIIKTYEPDYSSGKAESGAPMDIVDGRFVALRFNEKPTELEK